MERLASIDYTRKWGFDQHPGFLPGGLIWHSAQPVYNFQVRPPDFPP